MFICNYICKVHILSNLHFFLHLFCSKTRISVFKPSELFDNLQIFLRRYIFRVLMHSFFSFFHHSPISFPSSHFISTKWSHFIITTFILWYFTVMTVFLLPCFTVFLLYLTVYSYTKFMVTKRTPIRGKFGSMWGADLN